FSNQYFYRGAEGEPTSWLILRPQARSEPGPCCGPLDDRPNHVLPILWFCVYLNCRHTQLINPASVIRPKKVEPAIRFCNPPHVFSAGWKSERRLQFLRARRAGALRRDFDFRKKDFPAI